MLTHHLPLPAPLYKIENGPGQAIGLKLRTRFLKDKEMVEIKYINIICPARYLAMGGLPNPD